MIALLFSLAALSVNADISVTANQGLRFDPRGYSFKDESEKQVSIEQYFNLGKPVVLAFVYFECPGTCTLLLNGMIEAMRPHLYLPGRDFELLVVSIDPEDTPSLAKKKKINYLEMYHGPDVSEGFHFLTGTPGEIANLTQNLGFHFEYDSKTKMYNHPSALYFFTTRGTLSSLFVGTQFKSSEFRGALVDAASGRRGTILERVNAFCGNLIPHPSAEWTFVSWPSAIILVLTVLAAFLVRRAVAKIK